jgi:large-conductance mechanosensitive channel
VIIALVLFMAIRAINRLKKPPPAAPAAAAPADARGTAAHRDPRPARQR